MNFCYIQTEEKGKTKTRKVMRLVRLYGGDTTRGKIIYKGQEYQVERQAVVGDDGQTTYEWVQKRA